MPTASEAVDAIRCRTDALDRRSARVAAVARRSRAEHDRPRAKGHPR
ncbi:hypothetical protein ACIGNX_27170 [Actinosynnema sp. NPDC053489]